MNTKLRQKAKKQKKKRNIFSRWKNAVFEKVMENVRKHRY